MQFECNRVNADIKMAKAISQMIVAYDQVMTTHLREDSQYEAQTALN